MSSEPQEVCFDPDQEAGVSGSALQLPTGQSVPPAGQALEASVANSAVSVPQAGSLQSCVQFLGLMM